MKDIKDMLKEVANLTEEQAQSFYEMLTNISEEDIQKTADIFADLPNVNYMLYGIDTIKEKLKNES